jgi:dipeptidyl aminopeptidase/acylaminoacyl peptidase
MGRFLTRRAALVAAGVLLSGSASPLWAAAPSPRQLIEVADLTGPALSPDGRRVAVRLDRASIEQNRYESAWYVLPVDGGAAPIEVGDGGEPLFSDVGAPLGETPQWSPDGAWIYYRARLAGQIQVWRARADGSRAEPVSTDAADVRRFALAGDGRRLFYEVGAARDAIAAAEEAEYDAGVRIDETIPVGQGLFRSGFVDGRRSSVRLTGRWMQRAGLLWDAPRRWRMVELATGVSRALAPAEAPDLARALAAAGPDGSPTSVSAATGARATAIETGGGVRLQVTRQGGGDTPILCPPPACREASVAWLAWRGVRNQIVFAGADPDRGRAQSLRIWDVASGRVSTILEAPGLIGGGRQIGLDQPCAVAAEVAVCVAAAASAPPSLVRIDLETGAETSLFAPNAALAAMSPPARRLSWRDKFGRRFVGWYFAPVGGRPGPAPLFVSYYACAGFLRGGVGDEWPFASLAGAGIAALCIDEPRVVMAHPDQLARYRRALSGVTAVIAELSREGLIDRNRVGMGGLSFGSEVTFWTAMTSHLLAAASVSSPAATPTYYAFHSLQGPAFTERLRKAWGLGSPSQTPARWRRLSPVYNLSRIRAPILMQMPEQEYLEAIDYFAPLARSGAPVALYAFPDEPHNKVQPRHKLAAYERNLAWFRFWLLDEADPARPSEVQAWRAMRTRRLTPRPTTPRPG